MTPYSPSKTARNFVTPALQRGLDILRHLAQEREGATLTEIAEALHIPFTTAYRLANGQIIYVPD